MPEGIKAGEVGSRLVAAAGEVVLTFMRSDARTNDSARRASDWEGPPVQVFSDRTTPPIQDTFGLVEYRQTVQVGHI
jgi:hypothetical protein